MPAVVSDELELPFEDVLGSIYGLRPLRSFPTHHSAGIPAGTAAKHHEGGMAGQGAKIQGGKDRETKSEARNSRRKCEMPESEGPLQSV
jgi:hypothetical protein